jgi:archaellum biogenesis ATPase FlaH
MDEEGNPQPWIPEVGLEEQITYLEGKYPRSSKKKQWKPEVITLSDVTPEDVDWRWIDRMPIGKLVIMQGDPEQGKSMLALEIASRISNGQAIPPDVGMFDPQKVLLLSAEDGLADTIVPRLKAMGADLDNIKVIPSVRSEDEKRTLDLSQDVAILDELLAQEVYGLIIIDPISAYTPNLDNNKGNVRALLAPLAELVDRHKVTLMVIRHLTKNEQVKLAYRGKGAIDYEAAARVVMTVAKNPENEDERIVVTTKNNLAPHAPAMAYKISRQESGSVQFDWIGESDVTGQQLMSSGSEEDRTRLNETMEFLVDLLQENGGAMPQQQVIRETKSMGFSDATVRRAKDRLGISSARQGAHWEWQLTPNNTKVLINEHEHLEPLGVVREGYKV